MTIGRLLLVVALASLSAGMLLLAAVAVGELRRSWRDKGDDGRWMVHDDQALEAWDEAHPL